MRQGLAKKIPRIFRDYVFLQFAANLSKPANLSLAVSKSYCGSGSNTRVPQWSRIYAAALKGTQQDPALDSFWRLETKNQTKQALESTP